MAEPTYGEGARVRLLWEDLDAQIIGRARVRGLWRVRDEHGRELDMSSEEMRPLPAQDGAAA